MKAVQVRALAKVNLTLDVIGRRADGYHELRSVFARISLGDDVRVRRSRSWHVAIHPPLDARPDLAERAAHELARRSGRDVAAAITIRKRIPLASGLGGGSSDAAAVLRALGNLWRLDDALLTAVAAKIGSDVPFFFHGAPLAEVGGRGEHVRAVAGGPWWGALALTSGRVRWLCRSVPPGAVTTRSASPHAPYALIAMNATPGWEPERELQGNEVPAEGEGRWIYRVSVQGRLDGVGTDSTP